jgi:hypothetical protein
LKLTPQALAMLTDGVDLRGAKLRPWYEREAWKKVSNSLNLRSPASVRECNR